MLRLEQDKYYVGVTAKTPEQRYREHLGNGKSWWTSKYRPVGIAETRSLGITTYKEAQIQENKVTREYMKQYGVNSVRGGDLTMTSELVVRFGYIFDKFGWESITTIVFLLLVIAILVFKG